MNKISIALATFVYFSAYAMANETKPGISIVEGHSGKLLAGRTTDQGIQLKPTLLNEDDWPTVWFAHEYVYCEAKWDERCEYRVTLQVPPGWQACKPVGNITSNIGGGYKWTPIAWYTQDPESPDRFRGYELYITAAGSGNVFDQTGGNIKIQPVGIQVIRADAPNSKRFAAGCEMPLHD